MSQGIPTMEALRAAIIYYSELNKPVQQWPPKVTGLDLMPQINPVQIPDTGSPPYFQQNAGSVKSNVPLFDLNGSNLSRPAQGDQANWLGTANKINSQPPTVGVHSWSEEKAIPEWRYPVEDSQMIPFEMPPISIRPSGELNETEKNNMEYVYQSHDNDDKCAKFAGKTFDMNDRSHRPVPPSEGLGYTNTHPQCKCYWQPTGNIESDSMEPDDLMDAQSIHRKIGQRSHFGKLHKVKPDGELSQRTSHRNYYRKPLKTIQEAIAKVRHEFVWLSDDYLKKAKAIAESEGGKLYLIRASQETITDHRNEGEPYRRKLSGEELLAMARTATNHGTDINHNPKWRTKGFVMDSEYDTKTKSIQMIVMESDDDIIQAIRNGIITAVSINGGSPRHSTIEPCEHGCNTGKCEMCLVPRGVILAELDDIAFTWVVTSPKGVDWNGIHIPPAEPGVKTTIIQPI